MVLVEVLVVLEIQGGERETMGEATGRDPHVVDRSWPSAQDGCRGQPPPGGGYCLVAGQYRNGDSQLASSSRRCWPQLRFAADQARSKRTGERALVQQRSDIGVQDGQVHG